MDTLELTKIATAALAALLLIAAPRAAIEMAASERTDAEQGGYKLPEPAPPEPVSAAAEAPAAFAFAPVAALLANASAANGAGIFKKCAACHDGSKGGQNKVGPNLWGVAGRKVASAEGFAYSDALKGKGGDWTFENLAAFVHGPKTFAPGTKMTFAGVQDPAQLADVLAFLRSLSDAPAPLPPAP